MNAYLLETRVCKVNFNKMDKITKKPSDKGFLVIFFAKTKYLAKNAKYKIQNYLSFNLLVFKVLKCAINTLDYKGIVNVTLRLKFINYELSKVKKGKGSKVPGYLKGEKKSKTKKMTFFSLSRG